MKVNTKGNQTFNVPNTDEGLTFLQQARKFLNHNHLKIHSRGRGTRKNHRIEGSLPISKSEWVALYIESKSSRSKLESEVLRLRIETEQRQGEISHLLAELKRAKDAKEPAQTTTVVPIVPVEKTAKEVVIRIALQ